MRKVAVANPAAHGLAIPEPIGIADPIVQPAHRLPQAEFTAADIARQFSVVAPKAATILPTTSSTVNVIA
jgi:hypothetical protein